MFTYIVYADGFAPLEVVGETALDVAISKLVAEGFSTILVARLTERITVDRTPHIRRGSL